MSGTTRTYRKILVNLFVRILWFPRPNHLKSHSSGLKVSIPCRYGIYTSCLFFRGIYTICFFFRKGTLFQHRTPPPTLCSYIAFVLLPTLLLTWLWKGRSYRCTPTFRHNRLCCTRAMPAFQFDEGVVELTIRMSLRPRWANNPHAFCNFILSLHNLSAAQTTHRLIHPHVTNMHSCLQFDKPLSQCTTNQTAHQILYPCWNPLHIAVFNFDRLRSHFHALCHHVSVDQLLKRSSATASRANTH